MSVATEIARLEKAKADIAAAIASKGVDVPEGTTLDEMAALIMKIGVKDYPYIEDYPYDYVRPNT